MRISLVPVKYQAGNTKGAFLDNFTKVINAKALGLTTPVRMLQNAVNGVFFDQV